MKERNVSLINRLKQYSLIASPLIAVSSVSQGQVVYRDLDPDVDLTTNAGSFSDYKLDLNNDGVTDFVFGVFSKYQTDTSAAKYNRAGVAPDTANGNAVMGYTKTNIAKYYYPSALNTNQDINNTQNFWEYSGGYGTFFLYYPNGAGFGQWKNVTNKYMGFRFKDTGGNVHYGWIRMDITVFPVEVVIKDLAYESTPDAGIKAGEGGPAAVESVNAENDIRIFSHGKNLTIESSHASSEPMKIAITDLTGRIVMNDESNESTVQISLKDFASGIYLVQVNNGHEIRAKKISVQ
ncbi:MAG: T9SS type A sorting domain-containing protein [Chitinophagales bacterium]